MDRKMKALYELVWTGSQWDFVIAHLTLLSRHRLGSLESVVHISLSYGSFFTDAVLAFLRFVTVNSLVCNRFH